MRRGEVLGARWSALDLTPGSGYAGLLTIGRRESTRVRVYGEDDDIVKGPKSKRGIRPVLLDDDDAAALKALKRLQAAEQLKAGPAYQASGYIASDELGAPVDLDWYSNHFKALAYAAGMRQCRAYEFHCQHSPKCIELKGLRRSHNERMRLRGVDEVTRAMVLGHTPQVNRSESYSPATMTAHLAAHAAMARSS
jgi:integrase